LRSSWGSASAITDVNLPWMDVGDNYMNPESLAPPSTSAAAAYRPVPYRQQNAISIDAYEIDEDRGYGKSSSQSQCPQYQNSTQHGNRYSELVLRQYRAKPNVSSSPREELMTANQGHQDDMNTSNVQDTAPIWDCFFVMEDGSGSLVGPEPPRRKGVRTGHLPEKNRNDAAKRRKAGDVCLRCRTLRIKVSRSVPNLLLGLTLLQCDGGNPCFRCAKVTETMPLTYTCMKAQFGFIVESGTCNYICMLSVRALKSEANIR
jgi:hypothetical protein